MRVRRSISIMLTAGFLTIGASVARAQTGGQGALEGTVTDPTGARCERHRNRDRPGEQCDTTPLYVRRPLQITPLIPGVYTVTVPAPVSGVQAAEH